MDTRLSPTRTVDIVIKQRRRKHEASTVARYSACSILLVAQPSQSERL